MIYLRGHLSRPLDAVFCPPSRLAVLRQLFRAKAPVSGRLLARVAGVNHQAGALALAALHGLGVVDKKESGRSVLWSLNKENYLVEHMILPMLNAESYHAEEIVEELRRPFYPFGAAVLLGGEAARSRLEAGEPLELFVVLKDPRRVRAAGEAVRALGARLLAKYGLRLEATVMTAKEAGEARNFDVLWQISPREEAAALASVAAELRSRA